MSRAQMKAWIEADQDRQEAIFDQLPPAQQAAILEREAVIVAVVAEITDAQRDAILNTLNGDDDPFAPATKPARVRPAKTYTFRRQPFGQNKPYCIVGQGVGSVPFLYDLSDWQYDRFVELANSGNFAVEIMDSDFGIAWTLRRKAE